MAFAHIIETIDTAPLNRGLKGVDWLAQPGNVPITFENGDVALFDHEGDNIYQGHFLFKSRGRKAIEHARAAFARMFTDHGCSMIFGMVPDFRRDAKLVVRLAGGKSAGARWAPEGPGLADVKFELFVLSKAQWKVSNR